jgi:hypothetical protein
MSRIDEMLQPRRARKDALQVATERLRVQIDAEATGRERPWSEGVDQGFARIESELRQREQAANCPDGPLGQVDETRPTLVRQSQEVCREYAELMKTIHEFRERVRWAADAFRPAADPRCQISAPPAVKGPVPDFGALRQEAEKLLADLDHLRGMETALVLESVTTDIGVGD